MEAKPFLYRYVKLFFHCSVSVLLIGSLSTSFPSPQQEGDTRADSLMMRGSLNPPHQDKITISKRTRFHIDQNAQLILYSDSIPSKNLGRNVLSASSGVFSKMEKDFGIALKEKVTVFLVSDLKKHPDMPLLDAEPEWASGSAYPSHHLMVIRTNKLGIYPDMNVISVFVHELSHIFLYHTLKESRVFVPTWFNEGIAMLEARKWGMRDSYELASSLIIGSYIPLDALRSRFPKERYEARRAYVESFSFLIYLAENYGESSIWQIISRMKEGYGFEESFFMIIGEDVRQVEKKWIAKVTFWYRWIPVVTSSITLWIGVTLLFILGYIRKKNRERQILKEWDEEERWHA